MSSADCPWGLFLHLVHIEINIKGQHCGFVNYSRLLLAASHPLSDYGLWLPFTAAVHGWRIRFAAADYSCILINFTKLTVEKPLYVDLQTGHLYQYYFQFSPNCFLGSVCSPNFLICDDVFQYTVVTGNCPGINIFIVFFIHSVCSFVHILFIHSIIQWCLTAP